MNTGAEAYEEVKKMAKVDVITVIHVAAMVAESNDAPVTAEELRGVRDITRELIECARHIYDAGYAMSDHKRLEAILERIA